jgi:hypothetical protein
MIHYKRAKVLASGVNSPMNKGILVTTGAASILSLTCLDPNGAAVGVTYSVPSTTSEFIPLYVKSWTGTNTPTVWEMN